MRHLFLLIIVVLITTPPTFGQDSFDKTQLIGNWQFQSITADSVDCNIQSPYPIDRITFTEHAKFSISGGEDVSGKFEMKGNSIRFYEATKNGSKRTGDQLVAIKDLNNDFLILELEVNGCNMSYPKYEKIK